VQNGVQQHTTQFAETKLVSNHVTRTASPFAGFVGSLLLFLFTVGATFPCFALDLAPRRWSHLPVGINVAGVAYAYTEAEFLVDPTILLEDVQMKLDTWAGKYIRTFALFDKSARIDLTQAYQEGQWRGLVNGVAAEASRSGWSDTFVRLAVNLYGAPPLRGKEFAAYRSGMTTETIVGLALAVRLPTGEYIEDKLINLGQNRYAFRPQLGVVHDRGKWTAETTGEVAFYTENDKFFNGNSRTQRTRYFIHAHLTYTFRPGLWVGAGIGYDNGGENSINGIDKDDKRQNIGWAFNFAYPINRYSGISVTYIGTRTQESVGFDSDTLSAALSLAW
jgi:Putative MetA-pathway of phenol degradation